ncbi:hypothetical protein QE152_g36977 [Popillia japonica]|uniref:Uncharacterized protein n=1 Tax=Popillia japonica TaxID=7064 RepID=A0AAW1IC96_POPJA
MNRAGIVSRTALDYMVSSLPVDTFDCLVEDPHLSDHCMQILDFGVEDTYSEERTIRYKTVRDFTEKNIMDMRTALLAVNWDFIIIDNVDKSFDSFFGEILWCFDLLPEKEDQIA